MNVTVNGTPHDVPAGCTVAGLLDRLEMPKTGVAVAMDGAVLPRGQWVDAPLTDGSAIEVLTAVQGG